MNWKVYFSVKLMFDYIFPFSSLLYFRNVVTRDTSDSQESSSTDRTHSAKFLTAQIVGIRVRDRRFNSIFPIFGPKLIENMHSLKEHHIMQITMENEK